MKRSQATSRRAAIGLLGLALAGLLSPSALSAQFSVQPVNVEMTPVEGTASRIVSVRNDGASEIHLRVTTEDFDQAAGGDHAFAQMGTYPFSCSGRLQALPSDLVVPAGGTGSVRIDMEPADRTCWSVVWIASAAPVITSGASIGYRVGVKVYGTPVGAAAVGEIVGVEQAADSDGAPAVRIALRNTGATVMRPTGTLRITDGSGTVIAEPAVSAFSVLPGRVRSVVIRLPEDLLPGDYGVMPLLDYGGDYVMAAQIGVRIR